MMRALSLATDAPGGAWLRSDGRLAVERDEELRALLASRLGPEAVALFARPEVEAGADERRAVRARWSTPLEGDERAVADLPPALRRRVEDQLHVLVPAIERLARDDPSAAPLVEAALSLRSGASIRVVGTQPVLAEWGLRSADGRAVLAPFMIGSPPTGAGPAPQAAIAPAPVPAASAAPAAPGALPLVAWAPLAALLALAVLVLIWILLPGVRLYPGPGPAMDSAAVDALSEEANAVLRARRDALAAALEGGQCRADGTLTMPGVGPGPAGSASAADLLPPPLSRVAVPASADSAGAGEASGLLQRLEAGTVLVLAPGSEGGATGTGFVVGPGLVVTNAHVVAGADLAGLLVTSRALGRAVPARILKASGSFEAGGEDFALLAIDETGLPPLALAGPEEPPLLSRVVAAGYPGDLLDTDPAFAALLGGDAGATPGLSAVEGTVNASQALANGAHVLAHSAPLASGNSGGPLVDLCGRVVGVNTYARQGPLRTLNFALATGDLLRFLDGTPAETAGAGGECLPDVRPVGG